MQALVYNGRGLQNVEDCAKPVVEMPGDAIVRITKTTICGTHLHILKGDWRRADPARCRATRARFLQAWETFGNAADPKALKVIVGA